MSVTFHSELGSPTGFRVGCSCEDNRGPVFGTYADAEEFYTARNLMAGAILAPEVLEGCEYAGRGGYCEIDSPFIRAIFEDEGPELNISNGNAIVILEALGLGGEVIESGFGPMPADCSGSLSAEDFLGRVLAAEVMSVGDPGTETEVFAEPGSATVIAVGRREGYTEEKLAVLREIAEFALAHGKDVVWS